MHVGRRFTTSRRRCDIFILDKNNFYSLHQTNYPSKFCRGMYITDIFRGLSIPDSRAFADSVSVVGYQHYHDSQCFL